MPAQILRCPSSASSLLLPHIRVLGLAAARSSRQESYRRRLLPQDQADRGSLMEAALQKGFVDEVSVWRRLKGTRFKLIDAVLFNVISPGSEDVLGQVRTRLGSPPSSLRPVCGRELAIV